MKKNLRFPAFVILCLLASASLYSLTDRTTDSNQDGQPDVWYILDGSVILQYRSDRNYDGTVDQRSEYDNSGLISYEEYDFNYDGLMDDFYYYDRGVLIRQEIDSNHDEHVDIWIHLYQGIYVRKVERDKDCDGSVDWVKDYDRQ